MKVLLMDNNDSFSYNIVDLFNKIKYADLYVRKTNLICIDSIETYDCIIISPGPGKPDDFPNIKKILARYKTSKPILGVCLGHQAICEFFGGKLIKLEQVSHGQKHKIDIANTGLYAGMQSQIEVGLYHSWSIDIPTLPDCFDITGTLNDKRLMSIAHKEYNIYGVQYHPESFMTEYGEKIIRNFLERHK